MNNENSSDQQYIGDKFPPPQPPLNNYRVVHQIPVQHLNSEPITTANTGSLPSSHNFLNERYRNNNNNNNRDNSPFNRRQDPFNSNFFNRPFFDRYDPDFGKRTKKILFLNLKIKSYFRPLYYNHINLKGFLSESLLMILINFMYIL